ncbi:MAG: Clp protease N-terminal domain-containing protein, partial [Actinomycetes bacterium]
MLQPGVDAGSSPAIRTCVDQAARVAAHRGASEIDAGDLLIAVVQSGGDAVAALRELGAEPATIIESTWHRLPHLTARQPPIGASEPGPGVTARVVLDDADAEARLLSHSPPAPVHLLLALAYRTAGAAFDTLTEAGITLVDRRLFAQRQARATAQPATAGAPVR